MVCFQKEAWKSSSNLLVNIALSAHRQVLHSRTSEINAETSAQTESAFYSEYQLSVSNSCSDIDSHPFSRIRKLHIRGTPCGIIASHCSSNVSRSCFHKHHNTRSVGSIHIFVLVFAQQSLPALHTKQRYPSFNNQPARKQKSNPTLRAPPRPRFLIVLTGT
jgi:hypothetical protein